MDLHTIETICRPRTEAEIPPFQPGDAPLAGGTWLFSEPQPGLRRLLDLDRLGWNELQPGPAGLRIGATCTLATLSAFAAPPAWRAAPLFAQCCDALVASFKVQRCATVGGNLCLALPAGSMAALAVALDGVCILHSPAGERRLPAIDLILGDRRTALAPGELLRAILLPDAALRRRSAFRRIALSPLGRSAALVIGLADPGFALAITAATPRPIRLDFPDLPTRAELRAAIEHAIPAHAWHDDVHGAPDWRRHMTLLLAEEIRTKLATNPLPHAGEGLGEGSSACA